MYIYICMYMYVYMYVCFYVCVYIYICVCVCIHIYTLTDTDMRFSGFIRVHRVAGSQPEALNPKS